ncbi:hypothetical protein L798_00713 [Zootermopsis nevadensis]|uniref:Uncharacterized protein n=1 Tax=Zootermopsis nevadensis TaxID=136037 RepID=A0A067RQA5_ZOONE|nr:hypothetical protein L798_00713 [Zootermopsis nevadensis]
MQSSTLNQSGSASIDCITQSSETQWSVSREEGYSRPRSGASAEISWSVEGCLQMRAFALVSRLSESLRSESRVIATLVSRLSETPPQRIACDCQSSGRQYNPPHLFGCYDFLPCVCLFCVQIFYLLVLQKL